MPRKTISDPVTNRLYALSGNECAFPGCSNAVTHQAAPGERPVSLGQRAHLVGVGRQGPRSRATPLSDDENAVENLTLFCGVHHPIVDGNPRIYSVEVLAKFKADHEAKNAPKELRTKVVGTATETVDLSLLPVTDLPSTVWCAHSRFRTSEEVREHLPRARGAQVLPFVLLAGSIWAFHDLADGKGPFRDTVDLSSADTREAFKLLLTDQNIYVWLLNAALRHALRRRGVKHDRDHDRYYFLADHETVTRRVEAKTKTGRRQSAKKVVRQEGEGTPNARPIWWHLAAQLRFEEFSAGAWGLTIRPEFHLTKDGREPLEPRRVGRRVTKRKSRMYNEAYFDAVHFWRYFLLDGRAQMGLVVGRERIVISGAFPAIDATWANVTDKRFDPIGVLESGNEDDVLDAVVDSLPDEEEWDWGAEHPEEDW